MPITFVTGDIQLTRAQVIGISSNARARHEESELNTWLGQQYPAAFATFRKQAAAGRVGTGDLWLWRDATPWLAILVVRSSGSGATRLRYVDQIAQRMAQEWPLHEHVVTLALARIGDNNEWPAVKEVLLYWLSGGTLQTVVYENHVPGLEAAEPWD